MYADIKTSLGSMVVELDAGRAPISAENFKAYAEAGAYDGTIFHRVIDGFMIQGGGFDRDMKKRASNDPIKNEWENGLSNERGTLAMARTNDPDSATNQFFINVNDNTFLDEARPQTGGAGYAVFGRVVSGMDVVDAIRAVPTGTKAGMGDVPLEPVVIESVSMLSDDEAAKHSG